MAGAGEGVRVWLGDRFGPELLEVLPTVGNGGLVVGSDGTMTVSYRIHPDAAWSDGTPVTGDDFAFTYQWIMGHADELVATLVELGADPADLPWGPAGAMTLVDPDSFVVEQKRFTYTLTEATWDWWFLFQRVAPRHDLEDTTPSEWVGRWWSQATPWIYTDGSSVAKRNPWFWATDPDTGDQLPHHDSVRIEVIASEGALEEFLTRDDPDVLLEVDPSKEVAAAVNRGGLVAIAGHGFIEEIAFNFGEGRFAVNPDSWNDYLEFRQAVMHAIDRERFIDEVFAGLVQPAYSYVPVASPSLSGDEWERYPYDPDRARQLLAEVCERSGRDCEEEPPSTVYGVFNAETHPVRSTVAALVVEMLEAVGIRVQVQPLTGDDFDAETWDLAQFALAVGWGPGIPSLMAFHDYYDPEDPLLGDWGAPDSPTDGVASQRYADLLEQMLTTFDDDKAAMLFSEAEQLIADEMVFVPLYFPAPLDLIKTDHLGVPKGQIRFSEDTWMEAFWYSVDPTDNLRTEP